MAVVLHLGLQARFLRSIPSNNGAIFLAHGIDSLASQGCRTTKLGCPSFGYFFNFASMFGKKEKPVTPKKTKSKLLSCIILVFLFGVLYSLLQGMPKPPVVDFQKAARERLDGITNDIPEIGGYACEDNDCRYVVYFDFKTRPADLETIIRGNTVTFSNFKQTLLGTSYVTFAARMNGKVIFSCKGDNGVTRECK